MHPLIPIYPEANRKEHYFPFSGVSAMIGKDVTMHQPLSVTTATLVMERINDLIHSSQSLWEGADPMRNL